MKDREGDQRSRQRPASAESTRERAIFYRRIRNLFFGVLLVLILFLWVTTDPVIPLLGVRSPLYDSALDVLILPASLAAAACAVAAIMLGKKARRHAAPRHVDLESPPEVLYLRPFAEDTDWRVYYSWGRDRRPTGFRQGLAVLKFQLRMQRQGLVEFGEILAELTRSFGNLAAIGEPGSPPILGADNVYVSDDNWQDKALEMARGAKLVILTAGTSRGVIWETENILRTVAPSRLLLVVPGGTRARRRKRYAAFREAAGHLFPRELPHGLKARVITFADDWSPVEDEKPQPPPGTSAHVAWWLCRVLP